MKKTNLKNIETKHEHFIFYGYGKKDFLCHYDYASLDGLTKTIACTCLRKGEEYNNLLEGNQYSFYVNSVIDTLYSFISEGKLKDEDISAIEDKSSTWPEIKTNIKKLLSKHKIPMSTDLKKEIEGTDRAYEMANTGKQGFQVILAGAGRKSKTVKYFDNQLDTINYILKSKYGNGGVIVGDSNIADFIKSAKFKQINKKKGCGTFTLTVIQTIVENKWALTKAYKAFCNLSKGTERGK